MLSPPESTNACAVFVTHHPDDQFPQRLASVLGQVDRIVIVDNGSGEELEMLRQLATDGIELIANGQNLGIGAALNRGAVRAAELGYRWVLTMDQDSVAHDDLMNGLSKAYAACPFRSQTAVVAANFMDQERNRLFVRSTAGRPFVEQPTAITAGSLISLDAWRAVGGFREDFFIDFVDNEFCLRLRSRSWRVIYTPCPLIDHAIGNPRRHRLLGMRVATSNHSPLRRYYMTRNRLVTDWAFAHSQPRAVIGDFCRIGGETLLLLLFEDQKRHKIAAMLQGGWHAVTGRMGRKSQAILKSQA